MRRRKRRKWESLRIKPQQSFQYSVLVLKDCPIKNILAFGNVSFWLNYWSGPSDYCRIHAHSSMSFATFTHTIRSFQHKCFILTFLTNFNKSKAKRPRKKTNEFRDLQKENKARKRSKNSQVNNSQEKIHYRYRYHFHEIKRKSFSFFFSFWACNKAKGRRITKLPKKTKMWNRMTQSKKKEEENETEQKRINTVALLLHIDLTTFHGE